MKQKLIALLCTIALFTTLKASAQTTALAYEKGNQVFKFGFGLGAPFSTGTIKVPPIQAIYEYGVTEEVSIGGILGYASSQNNYDALGKVNYSYLVFGGRANYHFGTTDKFDPYGGATLGYNKVSVKDNGDYLGEYAASGVIYGAQIGANYYFNKNVGAWAEVGYGVGYLNLGVFFKF